MLPRLSRGARATLCDRAGEVLVTWSAGKSPATLRAYASDLVAFAVWAGGLGANEAVAAYLTLGPTKAYAAAQRWHGSMEGLAPRTIARRLSTLRSLVRSAKRQGVVAWDLDIEGPKVRGFTRDTTGPTPEEVGMMLWVAEAAAERGYYNPLRLRDLAILYLLIDSGLRRSEVCSLHIRHVNLARRRIFIEEKGSKGARRQWSISGRGVQALKRWLDWRTARPGPLFTRSLYDIRSGLDPSTIYRIVRRRAEAAGFSGWRPHGFRHTAGTYLKRRDPTAAQHFLRHAQLQTTLDHYDDAKGDGTEALVDSVARACSVAGRHQVERRQRRGHR